MVLIPSETRIYEVFANYHLLTVLLPLLCVCAVHLVKALFRLFRRGVDEVFGFLTFFVVRWYKFLGDTAVARSEYKERIQS